MAKNCWCYFIRLNSYPGSLCHQNSPHPANLSDGRPLPPWDVIPTKEGTNAPPRQVVPSVPPASRRPEERRVASFWEPLNNSTWTEEKKRSITGDFSEHTPYIELLSMRAYNPLGIPSGTSEADNIIKRPPSSLYFQDFSEVPHIIAKVVQVCETPSFSYLPVVQPLPACCGFSRGVPLNLPLWTAMGRRELPRGPGYRRPPFGGLPGTRVSRSPAGCCLWQTAVRTP